MLITGLSPAREVAIQQAMQTRIIRASFDRWRAEVSRAMKAIAEAALTTQDVDGAVYEHRQRVERLLVAQYTTCFETMGGRILKAGKKCAHGHEVKRIDMTLPGAEIFEQSMTNYIRSFGSIKVTEISGTTKDQAMRVINQAIEDGIAEGLAERQLGKLIRERISQEGGTLSRFRGEMIARTETHGASTAANHEAARAIEMPVQKQWLAAGGSRTREDHAEANLQIRNLNDPFTVGGVSLMYPGDATGPADQIINCRCVEGIVV
jgi:uncharacterized protein with gpF-like domain